MYYMANGVQASYVEVDCDTGFIRVLGQWAVDDCGRVINPLLVDEQVRGGIVQGIGAVLFEECIYSDDANLLNGTMADYLVPMADEMPDIVVGHVETPEASTKLGAKGIGEAGLIGAMGSVWVAVNDALKPHRRQDTAPAVHARARSRFARSSSRVSRTAVARARRRPSAPIRPGPTTQDSNRKIPVSELAFEIPRDLGPFRADSPPGNCRIAAPCDSNQTTYRMSLCGNC